LFSVNVQVAANESGTISSATQAEANVMASGPEIDDAVAVKVPVPENEHPGAVPSLIKYACVGTVKTADVSCDPETVAVSVAWRSSAPPGSSTINGPERLALLCVTVQDLIGDGEFPSPGIGTVSVPVHVPPRLRMSREGELGASEVQPAIDTTHRATSNNVTRLERTKPPFEMALTRTD
jgi:hypothetical protein